MFKRFSILLIISIFISGCMHKSVSQTSVAKVVGNFDENAFLGRWYVIGKMDPYLGKNFINQEINYVKSGNDLVFMTKAYNESTKKMVGSKTTAKFVYNNSAGALRSNYFSKTFSPYNIVKVDSNYKYALVYGKDTKEIWFLSRTRTMPEVIKAVYEKYAKDSGYNIDEIDWEVQRAITK